MKRVKSTLALAAVLLVTTGSFKIARAHLESSTSIAVSQQRPPVNDRPKDRKPAGTRAVETPSRQEYFYRGTIPAIALGVIVGILCVGLMQRQLRSYHFALTTKLLLTLKSRLHRSSGATFSIASLAKWYQMILSRR